MPTKKKPAAVKPKKKPTIVAECIVDTGADTGYGTDSYDPTTQAITHAAYAGVKKVISGDYWAQYDSMSQALHKDFRLPWGFGTYRLFVYSDGRRAFIEEKPKKRT